MSEAASDRDIYLRTMSDRLHDRFLERPAFLDLDFIRSEVKKLESQIDALILAGSNWPAIYDRLGDPLDYADAVFAQRLLSPSVSPAQTSRPQILVTVLKILFVVAPVNFIFAVGPFLIGCVLNLVGWIVSLVLTLVPVLLIFRFSTGALPGVGAAELLLLIAIFAFGQILGLTMLSISRVMIWALWKWLNWNLAFLRAEPRA